MVSLEIGWIGVFLVANVWLRAYRYGWRGWRGALRTRRYRELSIALLGSIFAIDVARLGGPAGYYPPDSWHYWFFLGLLMAVPSADQELAAEEEAERARLEAGRGRAAPAVAPAAAAAALPRTVPGAG
jgi:hypothetical protein